MPVHLPRLLEEFAPNHHLSITRLRVFGRVQVSGKRRMRKLTEFGFYAAELQEQEQWSTALGQLIRDRQIASNFQEAPGH